MTFEEAELLPRSEKITLATLETTKQAKLFTVHSGSIYYRDVDYFVSGVKQFDVALEQVYDLGDVSSGIFYYDIRNKRLYLNAIGDGDPVDEDISITYRHFFSNAPLILPYDLSNGENIEWLPFINKTGAIGQRLDDENTGVVLESQSSIDLINNHGYFDDIFDTLIWDNQSVKIYKWYGNTNISEARLVFDGVIESKSFSPQEVSFRLKDFVFKLRSFVDCGMFSEDDGSVLPTYIGTAKRRIYGQAKQLKCAGVDASLGVIQLTGTISIPLESNVATGIGTSFLTQLNAGDSIFTELFGEKIEFAIQSVDSNTQLTLGSESAITIEGKTFNFKPSVPSRYKNREWLVAGHKLREATLPITEVSSSNRFVFDSVTDIYAGDLVLINNDIVQVRRVSGNEVITETAVSPIPSVGDDLIKIPIQNVYHGTTLFVYQRDWTYENTNEAKIIFDELAEFNVAREKFLGVNVTFTNGSRSITTVSVIDFRTILKPRDWIRKNSIVSGQGDYYEIVEVKEQEVIIRSNYTGTTATTSAKIKNVEYIDDNSLITCDCMGYERDSAWVKTGPQAVYDLIRYDAGFLSINEASFTEADEDAPYVVSVIIPKTLGDSAPLIRDVITDISESVIGSLYGNSSMALSYSVLNSEKPETEVTLKDDDIVSWKSSTTSDIRNEINIKYRPYTDLITGEESFEVESFNSGFVDKYIGINSEYEKTCYLYNAEDAQIMAQRYAMFKSMPNTKIEIQAKTGFFSRVVNDKIFISLDRIFKRYGATEKRKVGSIVGISKSDYDAEVTISDIGNIFNRVPSICPDSSNDFSSSSEEERIRWGYIVDDSTLTPDTNSEYGLGNNLIG